MENFEIGSELLYSWEFVLFNENQDVNDYRSIIAEWVAANQEYVKGLTQ
ncbi:hypothetical protein [Enteractinococcus coprophilus]|nr:hypothetical protein [Enteractinococcus coprophilus]